RHLGGAIKKLEADLKVVASPELQRIQDELDQERARLEETKAARAKAEGNRSALEGELTAVNTSLRSLEAARLLQEKRDGLAAPGRSRRCRSSMDQTFRPSRGIPPLATRAIPRPA